MTQTNRLSKNWWLLAMAVALLLMLVGPVASTSALTPLPTPDPKPGSFGIEATKPQPPPTVGARITTPNNGASFSTSPITVSGICPNGLLVQIYNNGVMVGAAMCEGGSFRLQVSLFAGDNDLMAKVFDDLGQPGPDSNTVRVSYTDTNFTAFGDLVTLTSNYGRLAAPAGERLTWPLQLSGGTGPYAFSIDWGDGSETDLMSQASAGNINISHVYQQAGIYRVNVRVTDSNGVSAFLQLIAVSSGQIDPSTLNQGEDDGDGSVRTIILWIPAAVAVALLFPTYWLGRRSQIVSLRNKMLKERDAYQE